MKIALRSMETSPFFKRKKKTLRIGPIKKCFSEKMNLILRSTTTIKNKFFTVYNFLKLIFID